jgi:hypothetical protein
MSGGCRSFLGMDQKSSRFPDETSVRCGNDWELALMRKKPHLLPEVRFYRFSTEFWRGVLLEAAHRCKGHILSIINGQRQGGER